jgi:hypothetical protein
MPERPEVDTPGPGYYHTALEDASRGYAHMFKGKLNFIRKGKKESELEEMIRKAAANVEPPVDQRVRKQAKPRESLTRPLQLKIILENDSLSNLGPGSYDLSFPDLGPKYLNFKNSANFVYREERKKKEREGSPGPGTYNLRHDGSEEASLK